MSGIPAAVAGFIADGRVGRLGTADPSGQPMVVPICYAWDGSTLFSALDAKPKTKPGSDLKRVRNIQENAKVSVVIDRYDEDWSQLEYAILQGEARLVTQGDGFSRGADLLLEKYPQYRAMGLDRREGLMIVVAPSKVTHWAFRAGARA